MMQSTDITKITAWIEGELGGTVERCERQVRWRPGWFVDLRRDDELLPLYVRGDRNEEFPPWPLEYERDVFELLQGSSIPVPKIYGFCPEPRAIVLERVEGRPNLKTAESEEERLSVLDDLAHHVAAMHDLDIAPFHAAGMAMPQTDEERIVPFFIEGEKLYLKHKAAADPRMEFVRHWVHRNLPKERNEVRLLHGDPGQFIYKDGHITAMLDFEWACLGDPLMDLGGLRLRAVHEPMGDITPLFRRYAELTGRRIDADALGFHTVAFIANTCLAISPAIAKPSAGVDYPEYVSWYVVALLFSLESIAEVMGIELEKPPMLAANCLSRWSAAFDVMASTFGNGGEPDDDDDTTASYRRVLADSLAKFMAKVDLYGTAIDSEYVADVSELLGEPIADWGEADRRLETLIATGVSDYDERLLKLFYRWSWRQVSLLEGVIQNDMWNVTLQPLAELVTR